MDFFLYHMFLEKRWFVDSTHLSVKENMAMFLETKYKL